MRVLSVASEVYPLIKTGGLADVSGALPGALKPLGVEMRTLVPGYPAVLAGLTDRRFLVLRFRSSRIDVQEVLAWRLEALPPVTTSTGSVFTHIRVNDPAKPFVAKFHRLGTPENRPEAMAIAEGLARRRGGV